jgi:PEP-CTERM motif
MVQLAAISPRSALAGAALAFCFLHGAQAQTTFTPFSGEGNVSVFNAALGTGGWVGSVDGFVRPGTGNADPLVAVVLFTLDPMSRLLNGTFEFTTRDLGATLFGTVTGNTLAFDFLNQGGQLSLDYQVAGGTGAYQGAMGYGLSFLMFDPQGGFNNYREDGLFVTSVPEPATYGLMALGLIGVAWARARPGAAKAARIK